jgi:hypothetical protein
MRSQSAETTSWSRSRATHICTLVLIAVLTMVDAISGGRAQTNNSEAERAHQEFIDRHYPFIELGAEPPGRFVNGFWQGEAGWRTRHGPAIVMWNLGRPRAASSALLPDGSRGTASFFLDHGFRRPSTGPRRWIYGTVDIKPDEVRFIDGAQPSYTPPPLSDKPDLEAELARDAAFLEALKDDRFALGVYTVFVNRAFFKGNHESARECGDRQAARLVAALRDFGESYPDYFVGDRLPGMWPDDRPARRKQLDEEIATASRPFSLDLSFPDMPLPFQFADENGPRTIETPAQLEDLKKHFPRSR